MTRDTIFALSSGSGVAGIAVVRLSGPATREALVALIGALPEPRRATLRTIRDPQTGDAVDSGVILFFPAPASFTGEDAAELQVHGSLAVIRELLRVLGARAGLRLATAGEFTQRAYSAGRMNLLDVEALGDLLAAETAAQARFAQLARLSLNRAATAWRAALIEAIAFTEAQIDFSDEGDVDDSIDSFVQQTLSTLSAELTGALASLNSGERVRRGFRIAILGPPNAGKSTLVNALADRDAAITSPIPGTTRDTIEVHLDLGGLPVVLIDTAGLHASDDPLEQAGMARSRAAAAGADLVVWAVPSGAPVGDHPDNAVLVQTKIDLIDSRVQRSEEALAVSAVTGAGLAELIGLFKSKAAAGLAFGSEAVIVAHARQAEEIRSALGSVGRARQLGAAVLELRAEELRLARQHLDRLTGRIDRDEILGAIFARFCIGK